MTKVSDGLVDSPSRYHLIDPVIFETTEGPVELGTGWLLISEGEYACLAQLEARIEKLTGVLSGLSSYLGTGLGDDATTPEQFDERIRWGIDHIGGVYRNRAAQVVEECSRDRRSTWGTVKRAILDDTALPAALNEKD